jgi:hypothetical protein
MIICYCITTINIPDTISNLPISINDLAAKSKEVLKWEMYVKTSPGEKGVLYIGSID